MSVLDGKVALVTGANGGLGLAISRGLGRAGCKLVMSDVDDFGSAPELCREIEQQENGEALYVAANLVDVGETLGLFEAASCRFGGIDILVNNAVVRHFAPIEEFSVAWWNEALAVNVSAAFHLARLVLPQMRARRYGRIINLSSVYGVRATANRVDYVTTKAALLGLTRAVAVETAGQGITCNAVLPGAVLSSSSEARIQALMQAQGWSREKATQSFLAGKQPTGRFIPAESVVELIVFLCGASAQDITGAVLPIDAGWLANA